MDWFFDIDWRRVWQYAWRIGLCAVLGVIVGYWAMWAIPWGKQIVETNVSEGFCAVLLLILFHRIMAK